MDIQISNRIHVQEYNALRRSVGWMEVEPEQARASVENSFTVAALCGGETVGMARAITDGSHIWLIADVVVRPDFQGNGIGGLLMGQIMRHIEDGLREGQSAFVNLMSAKGKEGFYEKFKFIQRPNETYGPGMIQWIHRK